MRKHAVNLQLSESWMRPYQVSCVGCVCGGLLVLGGSSVAVHLNTVHPHRCSPCLMLFTDAASLIAHDVRVHWGCEVSCVAT